MSEKIVQLNEEEIKGQIKELVRGSVEETLNELLEAEAEKLTQAARYERNEARQATAAATMTGTIPPPLGDVTLHVPRLKGVCFKQPSLSDIAGERAAWRKRSSRCTLPVFPCAVWRILPRPFGAARYLPSTISELNKKAYVPIGVGATGLCKVGAIRTSMWMGSICAETGAESLKMWPFWWRLQ